MRIVKWWLKTVTESKYEKLSTFNVIMCKSKCKITDSTVFISLWKLKEIMINTFPLGLRDWEQGRWNSSVGR